MTIQTARHPSSFAIGTPEHLEYEEGARRLFQSALKARSDHQTATIQAAEAAPAGLPEGYRPAPKSTPRYYVVRLGTSTAVEASFASLQFANGRARRLSETASDGLPFHVRHGGPDGPTVTAWFAGRMVALIGPEETEEAPSPTENSAFFVAREHLRVALEETRKALEALEPFTLANPEAHGATETILSARLKIRGARHKAREAEKLAAIMKGVGR